MKNAFILVWLVMFSGCSTPAAPRRLGANGSSPLQDPTRLTSFSSGDRSEIPIDKIEMVYFSDAPNPTAKKARLFITGGRAFRSIDSLEAYLVGFRGNHTVQFILESWDVMPGPVITWEEIDALVTACRKADVWFTFAPGG